MAGRDIIVIGTSSGGVVALTQLVQGLPAGLPASLFIVCHFPSSGRSMLPEILSRAGPILASHAHHDEPFAPGHIYVAPPDYHLLLAPNGVMRLSHGARENLHRPAVDPLFRSAARHYGERVIGVILTGALHDGTAGLMAVRAAGGVGVVQDARDAFTATMPQSASQIAGAEYIVSLADMPARLVQLVRNEETTSGAIPMTTQPSDPLERATRVVQETMDEQAQDHRRGQVSALVCPECGGALWQLDDAKLLQFRCHVGHVYNGEVLLDEQNEALEAALWTAVRTFREKAMLSHQLAVRERVVGNAEAANRYDEQSAQAAEYAHLILKHVLLIDETNGQPLFGSQSRD